MVGDRTRRIAPATVSDEHVPLSVQEEPLHRPEQKIQQTVPDTPAAVASSHNATIAKQARVYKRVKRIVQDLLNHAPR